MENAARGPATAGIWQRRSTTSDPRGPTWRYAIQAGGLCHDEMAFAYLYNGRLHFASRRLAAAASFGTRAVALFPRFAEAACLLGDTAAAAGDRPKARSMLSSCSSNGPCPTGRLFQEMRCYDANPRSRLLNLQAEDGILR